MSTRTRRLSVVAAFALLLSVAPTSGFAYPLSSPTVSRVSTADTSPLRSLLNVFGLESSRLWLSLGSIYSDAFVSTDCQEPC